MSRSSQANAAYGPRDHNYTMMQAFEWYVEGDGTHWKDLKHKVGELAHMGITAMWLPPPCKASSKVRRTFVHDSAPPCLDNPALELGWIRYL